ncbi:MAG: RHS repeat-associated core domain-containing protein [Clostridiaceae bacterium]
MNLTYKGLKIEIPYEAIQVEDIEVNHSINEHSTLRIKILIEEGKILDCISKDIAEEKIVVNNEKAPLFIGKISDIHMSYEGGLHFMEINCVSYTKDLDIKKNSRTFCNLGMSYKDVILKVLEGYPKATFKDEITDGALIEEFLLQYEETDWEFLKRIASHFNAVLLSECTEEYARFYFGLPKIGKGEKLSIRDYDVVSDIETYNKREALGFEENFLQEYITWDVICDKKFELGEEVRLNDIKCKVAKVNTKVYKEELKTVYTMAIERGLRSLYKTNHRIFGMSIPAVVKEVKGNMVKVHFEIDEKFQDFPKHKYFTYAIESSSWYCMPEKDSEVHIYFPTNDETEAIAIHAVRNNDEGAPHASKTQNPDIKSFSNPVGSEMKLTPEDMNFTADSSGSVAVNLSQSGDVTLTADKITFTATENLELGMRDGEGDTPPVRPESIQISAGSGLSMKRDFFYGVTLTDANCLVGALIEYEGSAKDPIPLPEEIANRGKDDDKLRSDINKQAQQETEQKLQEAKSKVGFGLVAFAIGAAAVAIGAAVTIATGGLGAAAGVAIAAGVISTLVGASEVAEGASNYRKVQSGDFSKSYNFMRDTVCGGNETLYSIVKYGSVLISGAAIAVLTGGAGATVMKKALFDMATDVGMNAIMDYAQDGKLDNSLSSYVESAIVSGSLSCVSMGAMNKLKKLEKAADLSCKALGRIRIGTDIALDAMGELATTGDVNILSIAAKKYISNKFCFSDPVDGATGSLYIPATDVVLPDIHEEFKIERKYESINKRVGALGLGWTSNFESCMAITENKVTVLCTDGHIETFNKVDDLWVNDKGGATIYTLNKEENLWIFKSFADKKTYKFNDDGKLITITDKYKNEITFTYVGENIETLTTFSGYKLFFTYKEGKVIQIKDELGRIVQYKYVGDYLTEVIHVDQGITRYSYNQEGYIDSITDQNGQTYTKNFFDYQGRVTSQDFPNGDTCKITYDDAEREVTFYYTLSERTEKTRFNKDGLVTHLFYEDGTTEEYKYDEYQNKIYFKDRNGFETFKEYNSFGSLLKETAPNGLITEFVYDEEQNLIKKTDNLGKEVIYTYDKNGCLLQEKTKLSVGAWREESYTYDSYGRVITKTDGNNNTTKYEYDFEGKQGKDPVLVITNSNYKYRYEYDEVGRNTAIKTDYGTIEFGYNNLNYVSQIKDANGNETKKMYDRMGNLISLRTPNGGGYNYKYDHMDRLIEIRNPLGYTEKTIRDSEGNIIKEVNPNYYDSSSGNGIGIEYAYDKDNRKIKTIYPDGGVERFFYDSNGNVIKHISPEYYNEKTDDGLGYSYTYDAMNNLTSIINEEGIVEKSFEYDLHGNIIKEIDNEGNTTLFKYDLAGNITEKRVPAEKVEDKVKYNLTCYNYDKNGNKILERHGITLVDEDDYCGHYHEINFAYDKENRLVEVKDKYGAKARYKYDCLNNKVLETFKINDTTEKRIHYIYDKVGNLIEKKEEIDGRFVSPETKGKNVWSITKYQYDGNGNITKIITPKGFEIGRVYDAIDRVIEQYEKDEENNIFRSHVYKYDKADNIIKLSEYSGKEAKLIHKKYAGENDYSLSLGERYERAKENKKSFEELGFQEDRKSKDYIYDAQNRLTHFKNILGNTTRLFYDKNDRIIKQVLPEQYDEAKDDGLGTTYVYNLKGQVVEVKNPLGETVTKNTYDPKGNLKTSIDGENNKVEYTYTLLGQIKDIITPNSRKENKAAQSYKYDARGNITGITDGNGNKTSYRLDDWGRITEITTPEGGVEKYTYDYAGNITSTTDANGGTIEYFYNSLGQVSEIRDQEGNSEYFYYDEEGHKIESIDRNGNTLFYDYNIDNNITFRKDKTGRLWETFEYNSDGTLSKALTSGMAYSYSYTEDSMLKSKSTCGKTLISYDYDKNGNTLAITDISGKSTKYSYDVADRVKIIKDNNENILATYNYNRTNNIKSIVYGNGVKTDYNYDGDGNVDSLVTISPTGEVLVDYNYAYDLNGNRLQKVSSKAQSYYSYDSLNRLSSAKYNTPSKSLEESFIYDKVGNRLTKTTTEGIEKYKYNIKNQLVELNKNNQITQFNYDKQGNLLEEQHSEGTASYSYNSFNQTIKAVTKEGNTLVNRYDAEGLRFEIEENERFTRFIFNKDSIIAELDENDNVISRFSRGFEVVSGEINDNWYYYHQDEQGSTASITNEDGKVENSYFYDAFGVMLESTENVHNRITYTGQQFDAVTQQYYLRARFYNPVIGRFTQEDVYRGDGLNLYAYCGNNPVVYYDPSGYNGVPKPGCGSKENTWNKFQSDNKDNFSNMDDMLEAYYRENPPKVKEVGDKVHGNSHDTNKPAIGYIIRDVDTDEILKYGETTRGKSRYTQGFYDDNNAIMDIVARGTKKEMHKWQHDRILEYKKKHGKRPPLNKSDY